MKNRSEIELIALIIRTALNGTTITKMKYRLCVSHDQLIKYLLILHENEMLEQHNYEEQTFIATDKGKYFLQVYMELNELATAIACKRNIITNCYYGLLTNTHVIRHAINCIQYLIITIRSNI